jgi:hypothetical protein
MPGAIEGYCFKLCWNPATIFRAGSPFQVLRMSVAGYSSLGSVMRSNILGPPSLMGGVHQSRFLVIKATFQFLHLTASRRSAANTGKPSRFFALIPRVAYKVTRWALNGGFIGMGCSRECSIAKKSRRRPVYGFALGFWTTRASEESNCPRTQNDLVRLSRLISNIRQKTSRRVSLRPINSEFAGPLFLLMTGGGVQIYAKRQISY